MLPERGRRRPKAPRRETSPTHYKIIISDGFGHAALAHMCEWPPTLGEKSMSPPRHEILERPMTAQILRKNAAEKTAAAARTAIFFISGKLGEKKNPQSVARRIRVNSPDRGGLGMQGALLTFLPRLYVRPADPVHRGGSSSW